MISLRSLTALAAALSFANLLHADPIAASSPEPWVWASGSDQCQNRITKSNCEKATARICAEDLTQLQNATEGDCSALYWYDAKRNTEPTEDECNKEFGGIFNGGAIGYDEHGNQTGSPLYVVMPTNGNGNCLKAPNDKSPVLAPDQLPNGQTLDTTCLRSSSRRKRVAAGQPPLDDACSAKLGLQDLACSATCALSVMTTGFE